MNHSHQEEKCSCHCHPNYEFPRRNPLGSCVHCAPKENHPQIEKLRPETAARVVHGITDLSPKEEVQETAWDKAEAVLAKDMLRILHEQKEVQESMEGDSWEKEFDRRFTALDWSEKRQLIDIVGLDLLPDLKAFMRTKTAEARALALQEAAAIAKSGLWEHTPDTNYDKVWHYNHGREDAAREIEGKI